MSPEPPWRPSSWELHLLWWLKLIVRYFIGIPGVIYSVVVLHDAIGTFVFGAIATSMDVAQLVMTLARAAKDEAQVMEAAMRHEEEAALKAASSDSRSDSDLGES